MKRDRAKLKKKKKERKKNRRYHTYQEELIPLTLSIGSRDTTRCYEGRTIFQAGLNLIYDDAYQLPKNYSSLREEQGGK